MVARVARGVGDAKSLDLLSPTQRDDVCGRHGQHLPPEALHVVAVQPARALQQLLRIDEVRRPDLMHVYAKLREPLDERARGAGVIEMDVGEEERARLALEAREQGLKTRRGTRIDDQAVQFVGADDAVAPQMHAVDQVGHPSQGTWGNVRPRT